MDWTLIKHFKPEEFDDPEHPGSYEFMNDLTIVLLERLRESTGWPIVTHNKFGLKGCVAVNKTGHAEKSYHYPPQCCAVDFHFETSARTRDQAMEVLQSGFTGIGVYYGWKWENTVLNVGFHVDTRPVPQVWQCVNGVYTYLFK